MSNFLSLHDEEGRAVVLYTNTNNLTVALGHMAGNIKFQVGPILLSFLYRKHTTRTQTKTNTGTDNITVALGQVVGKRKSLVGPILFSFLVHKIGSQ